MDLRKEVYNKLLQAKAKKYNVPINKETLPHLLEEVKNDFRRKDNMPGLPQRSFEK